MNNLNSRQRKLLYAFGILLLLVPIIFFGAPVSRDVQVDDASVEGGYLAQLRHDHQLGETTLGEIDPSSSAMNLVLLGMKGMAVCYLHQNAIEYQERKDWAKLRETVDSIIMLQPHYREIWKFQGWNLAYNVSREWDKVDDRYFWVKEGIKFIQEGTNRNQKVPILFHNVGEFISSKMGISDEKKFFRQYFVSDPNVEEFNGGADTDINPKGIDSFLVAYDWFTLANAKDDLYDMTGMTHVFFRQGPPKARLSYAEAQQKDGLENDDARQANRAAWDEGYREWMDVYGVYEFRGLHDWKYKLNSTEEDLVQMAEENGISLDDQRNLWARNVDMVHYRFWRDYANAERDPETVAAHQAFFEGKKAYNEARSVDRYVKGKEEYEKSDAERLFDEAMQKWVRVFEKYPNMSVDSQSYIDEALLTVYYWMKVHENNGRKPPTEFPLKAFWEGNADRRPEIEREFMMDAIRVQPEETPAGG